MNNFHLIQESMGVKVSSKETPVVGLCGTMFVGSDRYAVVVTEVCTPKKVKVRNLPWKFDDLVETKKGLQYVKTEHLDSIINEQGTPFTYTLRKNNRWMPKGKDCWGTCSIHFGHAQNYQDPSF